MINQLKFTIFLYYLYQYFSKEKRRKNVTQHIIEIDKIMMILSERLVRPDRGMEGEGGHDLPEWWTTTNSRHQINQDRVFLIVFLLFSYIYGWINKWIIDLVTWFGLVCFQLSWSTMRWITNLETFSFQNTPDDIIEYGLSDIYYIFIFFTIHH